jgi:NAD(P)-dependent dehydrogenase (short-subunit alcohol dehydrogenase family)
MTEQPSALRADRVAADDKRGADLEDGLRERRLLVIGASSGIGRALAVRAAQAGARVVATARRMERLDELALQGDGKIIPLMGDVTRESDCERLVDQAARALGGLDALIYAAGVSSLAPLLETDGETWRTVLQTNVIGAALTCRAALGHLAASNGGAIFLSSISSEDPRPYLVPYGASKAALDAMIKGWRSEHPHICFTRIVVGPTSTEFGTGWAPEQIAKLTAVRTERGLLRAVPMTSEQAAGAILGVLQSPVWLEDMRLMPVNSPS